MARRPRMQSDGGGPPRRRRPGAATALVALLLGLAGCGSGSASDATSGTKGTGPSGEATSSSSSSSTSTTVAEREAVAEAEAPTFTLGLPDGWEQAEANAISDLYVRHATLLDVELAVRSSPMAGGAEAVSEYLRSERDTLEGYTNTDDLTATVDIEVGGDPAQAFDWSFTGEGTDGAETQFRQRRVIIAAIGRLYDVTFQAPAARFDELEADLDVMLRTWAFA